MKATIKVTKGSGGWWLTPEGFFENDRTTPLDLESESADELRRTILRRLFILPRWGGEEGPYGTVSVGVHSLLVSFLAGRLAEARDCSDEVIRCAKSYGALHDMGERLGPGDICSPLLRAYPGAREMNEGCQSAADRLFDPWIVGSGFLSEEIAVRLIVKDADHLAATIERRYLFNDDSRDCEASNAESLMAECGFLAIVDVSTCEYTGLAIELVDGGTVEILEAWEDLEEAIKCER